MVLKGEEVVITLDNIPTVKMVLFKKSNSKRRLGTANGKIEIGDDFDEDLEDFEAYS